jgi:molybdopterin-binding protein
MEISLRNQLKGKIVEIISGPVVSEVEVETSAGIITSVITTRSVQHLGLKVGEEVLAVVKATEVGIEKP